MYRKLMNMISNDYISLTESILLLLLSILAKHGPHKVQTWSKQAKHVKMDKTWSEHGQNMVKWSNIVKTLSNGQIWLKHGQNMVKTWSNMVKASRHGQSMVKTWSKHQDMVKASRHGQSMVTIWSKHGQSIKHFQNMDLVCRA